MSPFQQEFGEPAESTRGRIFDHLNPMIRDFIGASPFCVLATASAAGDRDASPKGGLIFLIPGCDWTVRVNGAARVRGARNDVLDGAAPAVLWQDDDTKVVQGLLVEVAEACAHGPRAFLFSKLWDVERLEKSLARDPNRYWLARYEESRKNG